MNAVVGAVQRKVEQAREFFATRVWHARLDQLPPRRAARYRASRIAYTTAETLFRSDDLHVRAAALTYFTVLSVVPLLAFVFAILKGFGAYDALVEQTIRPYVLHTLDGNTALQEAVEQILGFVSETGVTSLGFLGLITLLYAAASLLRSIEVAMNGIWGVHEGRSPLRQLTDYAAIIMVTPMCLLLAAGLGTATQLLDALRHLAEKVGMAGALDWAIGIASPLVVVMLGVFVLYRIMPNTNVDNRSAAIGAVVGGLLWYGSLIAHVRFQVGVAKFNALYSSFGIIPIFLVWLYLSWLTVLLGAQVAASYQQSRSMGRAHRTRPLGQRGKEAAALSLMLQLTEAFVQGATRPTRASLLDTLDLPEELLDDLLDRLEAAGLLVRAAKKDAVDLVLGRSPDRIHVKDVLDTLRGPPLAPDPTLSAPADPVALLTLHALDREVADSAYNTTLASLLHDRHDVIESGEHRMHRNEPGREAPNRLKHV